MKPITRLRRKLRKRSEIKVSSRIKGRVCDHKGTSVLLVEQKMMDIFTANNKSIHEAMTKREARVAVDETLLFRAREAGVTHVVIYYVDTGHTFAVALADFFNKDYSLQRTARNHRMARMIDIRRCGHLQIA
jgi:hypothetical protein